MTLHLNYVPLLQQQRDLYDTSHSWDRFRRYIQTMTGGGDELELPLGLLNPMGKEHVPQYLDALIELDADTIAQRATANARQRLSHVDARFNVALVLADDVGGGWTDRHYSEAKHYWQNNGEKNSGWISVILWTGDKQNIERIKCETLAAIYRALYQQYHGLPNTLKDLLCQEGLAALFAGQNTLDLDSIQLDSIRSFAELHLTSDAFPLLFSFFYGDSAAEKFGYSPLGLPERAGYALALAEALQGKYGQPEAQC